MFTTHAGITLHADIYYACWYFRPGIFEACWYLRFMLVFMIHAGIYDPCWN